MKKGNELTPLSELAKTLIELYGTPGNFIREIAWLIEDAMESNLREDKECIIQACVQLLSHIGEVWADANKEDEQNFIETGLKAFMRKDGMKAEFRAVKKCEEGIINECGHYDCHASAKQRNIDLFAAFCKTEYYINNPVDFEAAMREKNYLLV